MSRHHRSTPAREWEGIRQNSLLREQGRRCGKCGKAGALDRPPRQGGEIQRDGTNGPIGHLQVLCRDWEHIAAHRPVMGEQELAWQVLLVRRFARIGVGGPFDRRYGA